PRCRRAVPFGEVRAGAERSSGPPAPALYPAPAADHGYPARMNVALLGGGRMGEALAVGLVESGWDRESLAIAEVDADRRHGREARLPGVRVAPSPAWVAADAEVLVVAVKPGDAIDALASCADVLPEGALVLSIAAGVTLAALEAAVPGRPV